MRDHTGAAWEGIVAEQVAAIDAILPAKAPRFVYQRREVRPCSDVGIARGAITVCDSDTETICPGDDVAIGAVSCHYPVRKKGPAVAIRLSSWWSAGNPDWMREQVCHELMHAITGVPDAFFTHRDTSCVHGNLSRPGPWDAEIARKAFAGTRRKHR